MKSTVAFDSEIGIGASQHLRGLYQSFNTYLSGHVNSSYDAMTGDSMTKTGPALPYLLQTPEIRNNAVSFTTIRLSLTSQNATYRAWSP